MIFLLKCQTFCESRSSGADIQRFLAFVRGKWFRICIPPLLPIYKKMKVRPIVLLSLTTLTMGVMNIVPWGGPCGRTAAAVTQHRRPENGF